MTHERIEPHQDRHVMRLSRLGHIKRYQKAARDLAQNQTVLDAGCGYGYGTGILASSGLTVTGVDVSREAIAHAKINYQIGTTRFYQGDLSTISFRRGSFDAVTCFEVLEHVANPQKCLDNFRRSLNSTGILFISVPNAANVQENNEYHVNSFDAADLEQLLATHGFVVRQRFGQYPFIGTLAGAVEKFTGCQASTDTREGILPRLANALPLVPNIFSDLYSAPVARNTARTIYFVADVAH